MQHHRTSINTKVFFASGKIHWFDIFNSVKLCWENADVIIGAQPVNLMICLFVYVSAHAVRCPSLIFLRTNASVRIAV